jgi:acetyl-CoA synthetase
MTDRLHTLLTERRTFTPPASFKRAAHVRSTAVYREGTRSRLRFWAEQARQLEWFTSWKKVLQWNLPHAKWFVGGKLNASVNCLDRHVRTATRNKVALLWEGEPGDRRTITYWELHREVNRFANALKQLGVKRGDRVAIYLPMVPEAVVTMLACARIGAPHSVVFGGFSAHALRDRINDAKAKVLVTADISYRRGQRVLLKRNADDALKETPSIQHVVVVRRDQAADPTVHMDAQRDHWYHRLMDDASPDCKPAVLDAEHKLFILYTSGTTGKPKGIVHTTGGYLTQATATCRWVFDLKDDDVYWCMADIGWVTGHTYVVYGPLALGATVLLYEGAPDWPDKDRTWEIVERYGVTVFYTAPTAIRAFMKWGESYPAAHDLSTLRLLGTVGEPINPEAWMWYHRHIGDKRCPIVDTWWQTETGGIMITPLPGVTKTRPGSATVPFPGIEAGLVDGAGEPVDVGGGFLVIRSPWPGMLRTIYGDDKRYRQQYWKRFPGLYFTGDGAKRDKDGNFWILGRVDDVLNVAGHRIGTMEVESALVAHPAVAEAAVVGKPHEVKGQVIVAFVILRGGHKPSAGLVDDLKEHV